MQKNKSLDYRKWLKKFQIILEEAISSEIGYGLNRYRQGASTSILAARELKSLHSQKLEIEKFLVAFLSLCKKHNILGPDEIWRVRLDRSLSSKVTAVSRQFARSINGLRHESNETYAAAIKEYGNRRRPRIPTIVAIHIVELLEDCKGNKIRASHVSKVMGPNSDLDLLVRSVTKEIKDKTIKSLNFEISKNVKKLKDRSLSLDQKREVNRKIAKSNREIKQISNFEVRWNPFNVSREMDSNYQWIRTMKAHLKKAIIAEGRPKIK